MVKNRAPHRVEPIYAVMYDVGKIFKRDQFKNYFTPTTDRGNLVTCHSALI